MNSYEKIQLMRQRCETMILSMLGAEVAPKWWKSPNKAFDGKTPDEMFANDPERVYSYVIGRVNRYG